MSAKELAEFLAPQVLMFGACFKISTHSTPQVNVPFSDLLNVRLDILMQA
jgi:hypothetical protein